MRRTRTGRFTLTNRLLVLAGLIVVVTTVLLGATTSVGVYRMAETEAAARQSAYARLLASDLSTWLGTAGRALRTSAGESALADTDGEAARRALAVMVSDDSRYFVEAVLIGSSGDIVAWWSTSDVQTISGPPLEVLGDRSTLGFVWLAGTDTASPASDSLWVTVPIGDEDGPGRVLAARLRTSPFDEITADMDRALEHGSGIVLDGSGRVLFGSGASSGVAFAFEPDPDSPDMGRVWTGGGQASAGRYAALTAAPGLAWRVAVVEPADQAWQQTWAALRPGIVGWAAALGVALLAALGVVGRVTRPLRQLEVRARAMASGAPVEESVGEHDDEVGRLLDAFGSVAQRLSRLEDVGQLLAQASDSQQVLQGITASITHMLGQVDVDILLVREPEWLEVVAASGSFERSGPVAVSISDAAWAAEALTSGEPVIASPGAGDVLLAAHGLTEASVLVAPLRAGAEIVGAVVVVRPGPEPFTTTDAETVRSFAAQASVAIRNSRLFDEERRSRREAETLRAIAERLASPLGLEETLDEVAALASGLLGMSGAEVVVTERRMLGLEPLPLSPRREAWSAVWRSLGPVAHSVLVLEADDAEADVRQALEVSGARSALLVPLMLEGSPVGTLVLLSGSPTVGLDDRRYALATTIATQASLALQNAYLYEQARSRADNLETIFRISHAVSSSLESRIVLNRVLDVVQKILVADAVMLLTYESARKLMTVAMARGILNRDMLDATFRPGEDVLGRVFETREPERYDRLAGVDTRLLNAAAAQGLESLLVVPLLARGRSIGVLAAFSAMPSAFSSEELDLLRTFASQAALAIDTAEMFSREHHVATVLQNSILPTDLPRVPGIEVSSVYLPAAGDAEIGGDYYDLFTTPDGRVVVTIGDVCGKGVGAATKTSMIKYAIRGMAVARLGPARILAELNRMLVATQDPSSIVTLWIGCLDDRTGALRYADGGHPPGLLLDDACARINRLGTTGPLLGAVAEAEWDESSLVMEPGATLLLYTDGVTEARNGTRFFGEGRVRRSLRGGGSPAEIAQRLLGLVQRFSSGDMRDDAAILALRRTPR